MNVTHQRSGRRVGKWPPDRDTPPGILDATIGRPQQARPKFALLIRTEQRWVNEVGLLRHRRRPALLNALRSGSLREGEGLRQFKSYGSRLKAFLTHWSAPQSTRQPVEAEEYTSVIFEAPGNHRQGLYTRCVEQLPAQNRLQPPLPYVRRQPSSQSFATSFGKQRDAFRGLRFEGARVFLIVELQPPQVLSRRAPNVRAVSRMPPCPIPGRCHSRLPIGV
ncbi:hypothetical protein PHO31112_04773 [Pandoraea horticolens]|uniref:Uncharacterized protein n=1 Tax=Pandoraea horticolens TaxID=2508298 RepID=A0A5E4YTX5_9BURK|nr:hypothetical protein PHO31112_04773 [Pandoraea horticolens]